MEAAALQEAKRGLDLAAVVQAAGVELRNAGGGRLRGLCPFHQERTPSFLIYPDQHAHCFGCGWSGDVIDFTKQVRGCSFKEALQLLGIERDRLPAVDLRALKKEREQREILAWREREVARTIGIAIRVAHKILERITPGNLTDHKNSLVLSNLPTLEYQHDLLIHGDPEDRAAVVAEYDGVRLFARRLLFRKDFDFAAWHRTTCQEPLGCTKTTEMDLSRTK